MIHTNHLVVVARIIRRHVASEDHVVIAEDTCHAAAAWDEVEADTAAEAVIVEKAVTTGPDRSEADHGVVAAAVTVVAQEGTAADQATTVDTTTDHLRRITRWAAIRAPDITKDPRHGSNSTHDNRQTRPR